MAGSGNTFPPDMKPTFFILLALLMARLTGAEDLPFDRGIINRYSLDKLPRSLSIRQGAEVWLGYDLERATVFKTWQAPAGKPGLIQSGFVTRSAGKVSFEDTSDQTWTLQRAGNTVPLTIRYLGCSQRETYFELSWELRHDKGVVTLRNRIPMAAAPAAGQVGLEIRAESLAADEGLLLAEPVQKAWKFTLRDGQAASALTGNDWHNLTLP